MKTILISSTQYPGYGGAATNAYYIIKYLRLKKYKVFGLFFYNSEEIIDDKSIYDPDSIGGIILSKYLLLNSDEKNKNIKNEIISYLGKEPDICFGKNYASPVYCKNLFPKSYIIYLVSGINHIPLFYAKKKISAHEILKDTFKINFENKREIECNEISNLIVLNSELSYNLFYKIYNTFKEKIYKHPIDTTKCISTINNKESIDNIYNNKKYDILICSSNLERLDKNNMFLIDILKKKNFDKYKKCIIGINNIKFRDIKNSIFLNLIPNKDVNKYMSQCKILLFPTLFDANSNTVREALNNNCIPIISNNLGNYKLFSKHLVCHDFKEITWKNRILLILNDYKKYYNDLFCKNKIEFKQEHDLTDLLLF
jgi:glycosyltransferase involved in cell wall biosynthesis